MAEDNNKINIPNGVKRPPVVVVMGHVDHGKSSLLEAIKDFKITSKESGGITQHIGAYQVEEQGKKITFLDTPGHEAFSQMRGRGARVADIAILVIDASEGIQAQTKEVLSLIKKVSIPTVLVLNKIDKPEADPERVKRELVKEDFLVESLGGKIPSVNVSAKTKKGIPELLDMINLVSDIEDLNADPDAPAEGVIIESYLDNQRGPTATLLVSNGTLRSGDIIGTSSAFTKIKSLESFQGKPIEEALPSTPVIVFGFNQVPGVGEKFKTFNTVEEAENNSRVLRNAPGATGKREEKAPEVSEGQRVLEIILKADVLGSLEAVEGILKSLPQERVIIRIIKAEAGNINESDVKLASGGKAIILGFKVKIDSQAKILMERDKVKALTFDIIYELVEAVRNFMERIAISEEVRTVVGRMKVLAKFLAEKNRQIIGGKVIEGEIRRGVQIDVLRNDEKIGSGRMINLQRNKKDINSVSKGEECGILFEGNVKIEEGDILEFYIEEKKKVI
ncbi:MAG: translation initiation factor IF-2 [Candidatus Pacebacteria bacterium]|nr:translation initiation factor IF-2 [Candidatus Paceibacterota bacterium]